MKQKIEDKIEWEITPGVEYINGETVGNRKAISLTETEAMFDKAQGRITPVAPKKAAKKPVLEPEKELSEDS